MVVNIIIFKFLFVAVKKQKKYQKKWNSIFYTNLMIEALKMDENSKIDENKMKHAYEDKIN